MSPKQILIVAVVAVVAVAVVKRIAAVNRYIGL